MANLINHSEKSGSHSSPFSRFLGDSQAIDKLARITGFQRRKARKITASVFLHAFVHAILSPTCSMREIAIRIGLAADATISRQALWKRMHAGATEFLSASLARVLAGAPECTGEALASLPNGIRRVLIADSTLLALHQSLADFFPGASNQTGVKQASARVQAVLDLVTGSFVDFQIGSFRDNDQKAADWIAHLLRSGDLILRDLGYFTLRSLRTITDKGAYFITRLRFDTSLCHPDGTPLDLFEQLRATTNNLIEMPVLVGVDEQLPVRLVAVRLSPAVAAERRRKAKADRDKRLKWSARRSGLLGWSITLDNLPEDIPAKRIYPIYALRWRVETVFKSWKTHLGMCRHLTRPLGTEQARAILCVAMIGAALSASAHARIKTSIARRDCDEGASPELSLLKTTPLISDLLRGYLISATGNPEAMLRQISYHCRYGKRRKYVNSEQALTSALFWKSA
jgi:Transposase DDE domain